MAPTTATHYAGLKRHRVAVPCLKRKSWIIGISDPESGASAHGFVPESYLCINGVCCRYCDNIHTTICAWAGVMAGRKRASNVSMESCGYWNAEVELVAVPGRPVELATIRSERSSNGGKSLPRFSARRRIPAHAVELKKYLLGAEVSSTCHNEHTAASLGHSEILGVKDSPRDCPFGTKHSTSVRPPTPWRDESLVFSGKCSKKASEGVVLRGEDSWDVFPDNGARFFSGFVDSICKPHKFK